jgi:bromodomain-containing protein 8
MIWQKFVDHRSGNTFLKVVKDEGYTSIIKKPMSLDLIRHRIKNGLISSTSELHRDILLMLANAIMYNDSGTEGFLY